jgi:hypothetical protein
LKTLKEFRTYSYGKKAKKRVFQTTLQYRHTGKLVQCNYQPNSKKFTKPEEEVIV